MLRMKGFTMNKQQEMTQLKVWIPLKDKIDFQVACTKANTNMTVVFGHLVRQYLKNKREIA